VESNQDRTQPQTRQVALRRNRNTSLNYRTRRRLSALIQLERTTYKIPPDVERNLIDFEEMPTKENRELPIFWDIAMSGSTQTIKVTYASCYHLVEACEIGGRLTDAGENPDELRVLTTQDGRKYINIDTTSPGGIKRASLLGFAKNKLSDLIVTPFLLESAKSLFDVDEGSRKGRMFSVFRHPVDRVVSMFYSTKDSAKYSQWTIDEYAHSAYPESNAMVRALTHKMTGAISSADTARAKEILRRKCLVGLAENMEESFTRFHHFFGFGDIAQLQCVLDRLASTVLNNHEQPALAKTSEAWMLLAKKNWADIRLYEYAQHLFIEQGELLKENGFSII